MVEAGAEQSKRSVRWFTTCWFGCRSHWQPVCVLSSCLCVLICPVTLRRFQGDWAGWQEEVVGIMEWGSKCLFFLGLLVCSIFVSTNAVPSFSCSAIPVHVSPSLLVYYAWGLAKIGAACFNWVLCVCVCLMNLRVLSLARCNWRPSAVRARTKLTELKQQTRAGKRIRCALLLSPHAKRKWQPKQTLDGGSGSNCSSTNVATLPCHFHWPAISNACAVAWERS